MFLVNIVFAYTMFFTSFNADIFTLHRAYHLYRSSHKFQITGGYTAFGIPFSRFSMPLKDLETELFLLSSGEMEKTDVQGYKVGSFSYSAAGFGIKKEVYTSPHKGTIFLKSSFYLETADNWYNPGISLSFFYSRRILKRLATCLVLRDLGTSLNPVELINFQLDWTLYLDLKNSGPYITFEFTPYSGTSFWTGAGVPLHSMLTAFAGYTTKYKDMRFGGGKDILNGLFLGLILKTHIITLYYFADFYGEGGITHSLEVKIRK